MFLYSLTNPVKDSKKNTQVVIGIEWRWLNDIFCSRWWMEVFCRRVRFGMAIPSTLPRLGWESLEVMDRIVPILEPPNIQTNVLN